MNIFVLDRDPKIAASMHCDQHLHTMIKESAQMLSTASAHWPKPTFIDQAALYKPAYQKHPCTLWCHDPHNALWVCNLAIELENIRHSQGRKEHASMRVIEAVANYLDDYGYLGGSLDFIFCGPDKYQSHDVVEAYQLYYIEKYTQWLHTLKPMSYKERKLPEFLSQYATTIDHDHTL